MNKKTFFAVSVIVYLLIIWYHPYIKGISNPNERIRFFLVHAVVSRGELSVNHEIRKFGDTIDKAEVNGKYYCDKAPLISLINVPSYYLYYKLHNGNVTEKDSLYFLKATNQALFALMLFWLFFFYIRKHSKDEKLNLFFSAALIFATPIFSFSVAYFSHSVTASLIFLFFVLLEKEIESPRFIWGYGAGFVGGLAVLNEYTSVPFLVVFSFFALIRMRKNPSSIIYFILGGMIPAFGLAIFNNAQFGSPFTLGYSHLSDKTFAVAQSKGLWGITFPSWKAFYETLFSIRIGALTLSPFLILSGIGFYYSLKKRDLSLIGAAAAIAAHFYAVISYSVWDGGGTFGSRHFVPVIPLLMVLSVKGTLCVKEQLPMVLTFFKVTALSSFLLFAGTVVNFSFFAPLFSNPLPNFTLIMIREGFYPSGSVASLLGIKGGLSFFLWMMLCFLIAIYTLYKSSNENKGVADFVSNILLAFGILSLYFIPYSGNSKQLNDAYMSMQKEIKNQDWRLKELLMDGNYKDVIKQLDL